MKNTTLIGKNGEDIACKYLENKGFTIVCRNYRSRYGEIDIIAKDDKFLAIVEVKKRKNTKFGQPAEYVDVKKQQKIIKTALMFLTQNSFELQPRFDVIEIYDGQINHIKNAFESV